MKCMLAQAVCSFLGHALAPSPPYSIVLAPCPQYSPTLAPNNTILHLKSSKHGNQTGSRIATHALAPCPPYSPGLAPYTGSHNSVLNLKNSRLEVDLQPQAQQWLPQLGSSSQELQIGSIFATPGPTLAPYTGSLHPVLPQGYP